MFPSDVSNLSPALGVVRDIQEWCGLNGFVQSTYLAQNKQHRFQSAAPGGLFNSPGIAPPEEDQVGERPARLPTFHLEMNISCVN